ncbi:Ino eighty subunit 1 [Venturia nashicola]|nr:Ino eighty subunit 1 [Venturia nashicola]
MAPVRRLVTAFFLSITALTFALPNHTPDAPGVLHRRTPNHTPDAPGVLHQRQPEPTPSAPGLLRARRPSDVPAYRQLAGRQESTITGAAPTATGAAPSTTPAMQVEQLVAGIGFNIMAQKAQVAVVSIMQSLGNAPAVPDANNMLYKVAKDDLLSFMGASMRIRGNNMQLSGVNPQITRGLAQLEEQQVLQMAMANNLTGDATKDGPMLQMLQSGFEGAIQKNMGLQSLATGGSNIPMMTKAAGI